MKMGWILGWAITERWFEPQARAAFPAAEHEFVSASAEAVQELEARGPFDWVIGYSFGAQLLLESATGLQTRFVRAALLAPTFSLLSEQGLGGRVARTQLRYLKRWLKRDFSAALADFYARAGLEVGVSFYPGRAELTDLSWGLDQLEMGSAGRPMPPGWFAWCGSGDPLLDARILAEAKPGVIVREGASHEPGGLLEALKEVVG